MSAEKSNNRNSWILRIVVAVVLIAALLVSLIWADKIDRKLGLVKTEETAYGGNSTEEALAPGAQVEGVGDNLNVHFVDVGQGDACIVELPDERTMLIDAGDTHSSNKKKLLSYIEENINDKDGNDIKYFDYAILTHPDSDHCGGMADVLTKYPAKTFYRPNVYSVYNDDKSNDDWKDPEKEAIKAATGANKANEKDTRAYDRALKAAYEGKLPFGETPKVHISDAADESISVITPELEETDPEYYTFTFYAPVGNSYTDNNNYSPVMILEYHGKRFMLSGDAEKEAEADFVAKATATDREEKYRIFDENFTVDVFKLGHHGSRTSSSEAFINVMTTPANCPNVIAIVSCGEDNSYGHPHKEVLERLKALGFTEENIVRTDVNGNIAMSVRATRDENGDAIYDGGHVVYELCMGAETVRRSVAAVGNDSVNLTWKEIVIAGIIIVLLVLIVMPVVQNMRKKAQAQARAAARASGSSGKSGGNKSSGKSGGSKGSSRK